MSTVSEKKKKNLVVSEIMNNVKVNEIAMQKIQFDYDKSS